VEAMLEAPYKNEKNLNPETKEVQKEKESTKYSEDNMNEDQSEEINDSGKDKEEREERGEKDKKEEKEEREEREEREDREDREKRRWYISYNKILFSFIY